MNVNVEDKDSDEGAKRRTQAERAETTRAALVTAARRLFGEHGYDAIGTGEIVKAAGVTRGALYHHFAGKPDLLEAAYRQIEAESAERVAAVVLGSGETSPLEAMKKGVEAFLDECAQPEMQRIVLHDAPAVLGWDRWRAVAAEHGLGLIEASLTAAIEAGEIRDLPARPMAHLLLGALDEAAMLIAHSAEESSGQGFGSHPAPPVTRQEVTEVLLTLLESFAVPAP
jgi:AcrR family transcriptional regulator